MTFIKKELLSVSTAHFCPEIDRFRTKKDRFQPFLGSVLLKTALSMRKSFAWKWHFSCIWQDVIILLLTR